MSDTPSRRSQSTIAALLIGLPLAAGVLVLFHFGPLRTTPAFRYVEWPTQWVEMAFFCTGLGALSVRLWSLRAEQAALNREWLPVWDGKPVSVDKAGDLLAALRRQSNAVLDTYIGRRVASLLRFICQRKSAAGLDDQLRALADADALHHDSGLGFIRFITWAIPILGFLGTVVGITGAIGGATAEKLETNMSEMTNGLAEAFDATALALGCTMTLMFLHFLVERQEQSMLATVDEETDRLLAHRFQIIEVDTNAQLLLALRDQATTIADALRTFGSGPGTMAVLAFEQIQQRILGGMGQAMELALKQQAERYVAMEQQSLAHSSQIMQQLSQLAGTIRETGRQQVEALIEVSRSVLGQAAALGKLQEGEANLLQLQAMLNQNLATLAAAGNFEEAVHSLTAAAHLLTARAGVYVPGQSPQGKKAA